MIHPKLLRRHSARGLLLPVISEESRRDESPANLHWAGRFFALRFREEDLLL
ncbi:hypothetical protein IID10_04480 [candidate division KSB1 bacterium]|nr:hypothetical protein [candidate division KSB1 bacterium]